MEICKYCCYNSVTFESIQRLLFYYYYLKRGSYSVSSFFLIKIMEQADFYYSVGDVSTTIPYRRPTLVSVTDWWKEFKYEVGLDDFNVYVCGSFIEKTLAVYDRPPNDLDIVFTGEIQSERKLKELLDAAMAIGFKHRFLVDAFWSSDIIALMDEFKPYAQIRNASGYIKTVRGELVQRHYSADEHYALSNGLHQYVYYQPSKTYKKVQERKDNGLYVGAVKLATEFFD